MRIIHHRQLDGRHTQGNDTKYGDAANQLGVSVITLRRWADSGKIRSERSPSGQRRFYLTDIKRVTPRELKQLDERVTINYARVSSHDQKQDLDRSCNSQQIA